MSLKIYDDARLCTEEKTRDAGRGVGSILETLPTPTSSISYSQLDLSASLNSWPSHVSQQSPVEQGLQFLTHVPYGGSVFQKQFLFITYS